MPLGPRPEIWNATPLDGTIVTIRPRVGRTTIGTAPIASACTMVIWLPLSCLYSGAT